jgi:prepilin-type N-terminal cleavage/methylation domain-containing protein
MKVFEKHKQGGFTLIELIVVVAIVGILSAVFVSAIRGTADGPKATAMMTVADNVAKELELIGQFCGITTAVASNPLPDGGAGRTLADVVFMGAQAVSPNYRTCYTQSGVKPLVEASQPGAAAGSYNVQGFPVALLGGGVNQPIQVSFGGVPDTVTLYLAQKYNPSLAALSASDTVNPNFRYSTAAADGSRTVTILKQ